MLPAVTPTENTLTMLTTVQRVPYRSSSPGGEHEKNGLQIFTTNTDTAFPEFIVHISLRIKAQARQRMEKEFKNIKVNYIWLSQ